MRTTDKAKIELEKLVELFKSGEAPKAIASCENSRRVMVNMIGSPLQRVTGGIEI